MKTLVLLRHAKSDWTDPTLDDKNRPLNERGIDAAPRMGAWLAAQGHIIEIVLVSAARRTRQTWALVQPRLGSAPTTMVRGDLYLASATHLLQVVQLLDAKASTALLIGHNPGMEELAARLAGSGDKALRAAMSAKFPTAGCAILTFDIDTWTDVRAGGGHLAAFMAPKRLD